MEVDRRKLPFFADELKIKLVKDERGRFQDLDQDDMLDGLKKLVRVLNERLRDMSVAINANDASAHVVSEADGLPTAARHYMGRMYFIEIAAAAGEFWVCRNDGSGGYEWKEVTVVP